MFRQISSRTNKLKEDEDADVLQPMSDTSNCSASSSHSALSKRRPTHKCTSWRVSIPLALIGMIGAGVCAAFLVVGVKGALRDQELRFEKHASELVAAIQSTWKDYHLGGLWIQEACRSSRTSHTNNTSIPKMCSREDFRGLYEYMIAGGLEFQAIAYVPNVTHQHRLAMEQESSQYYKEHYPHFNYTGFMDIAGTPKNPYAIIPSPEKPFYFPNHLVEPLQYNEHYIDVDTYSTPYFFLMDDALRGWSPVLTAPVPLPMPGMRQVILMHPGAKLSTSPDRATSLSSITVPFWALMQRSVLGHPWPEPVSVYVFDTTRDDIQFGGALVEPSSTDTPNLVYTGHDVGLDELRQSNTNAWKYEQDIPIEQQVWTVLVVSEEGTYKAELTNVVLGGCFILAVCACVAVWLYSAMRREAQVTKIQQCAEAEKSALIVDSAQRAARVERQAAQAERQLNEYLAHEVRNPLTSAMSACSFLTASNHGNNNDNSHKEDIHVIRSSLSYIDDLLRSSLDMHKVESKQLRLEIAPTDVLKDIFEPVRTILHRRDNNFDIHVECPQNLVVMVDRMRIKQIILNLAGNSRKFVQKGYIRLAAMLVPEGWLQLSVADSGPGIPPAKRNQLFERYQSSLDMLNQGTGMGLCLCNSLVELMNGHIELDDSFDSGVKGFPGARFVISLPECQPINLDSVKLDASMGQSERYSGDLSQEMKVSSHADTNNDGDIEAGEMEPFKDEPTETLLLELPEKLSVLVVDDDLVLRKLLCRSLRRVAPGWSIQEAANGETALVMADSNDFDLIFMDQYMASVDKQLLGTETVFALRGKGVQSLICGLSANDMEEAFLKSGANAFLQKPFSCDQQALKQDLLGVLSSSQQYERTLEV